MQTPLATSTEASTSSGGITSQLQARLSQPPSGPTPAAPAGPTGTPAGAIGPAVANNGGAGTNREQLRYLLQRGSNTSNPPSSGSPATPTEATAQISLSTSTTSTGVTTTRVWVPETDNSLQPGMAPMQRPPQFRHPLPPDVRPQSPGGVIRPMGPNIQGMNVRQRMMMPPQQQQQLQRGQLPPGAVETPMGNPAVSQNSPLLAQQLQGRPAPNQQAQQGLDPQQQQSGNLGDSNEELEGLDNVNELGDLGMGEEDLLGMGDNFDIFEFADALDDLENLPENDPKKQGASNTENPPSTQPPPYSQTQTNTTSGQGQQTGIRAPPPPYGANPSGPKEQPLLLEDLLEQEKREQQQQNMQQPQGQPQQPQQPPQQQQQQPQPQGPPQGPQVVPQNQPPQQVPQQVPQQPQMQQVQQQQQHPPQNMSQNMPVGAAVLQQVRPPMQQMQPHQGAPHPPGAFPVQQRPMLIQQGGQIMQQGQWIRHPQEVTLQQRGPMGGPVGPPPPQVMGIRGPPPNVDQHPALIRQESTSQPPPPPLNTKPMTPPPENPVTDEDKAKVVRYEQWLMQQEQAINLHLRYYETEISKLRKSRKSLNSKQRTMRKNGNDLNERDQNELDQVTMRAQEIQKTLEKIRKQSRQHAMLTNDHKNKKQKAMGIDPSKQDQMNLPPGAAQNPHMIMQQQPMQPHLIQQQHQRMQMRPGMHPGGPRMMVLPQQQQQQPQMGPMRPQQGMQRMVMMQGPHGGQQARMVMMPQQQQHRMQMMRMPQGTMMRMQQPFDQQPQQPPQMSPRMSPHNSSQPSPHSMHSGQPSPQNYPVTSPGRPGMTSPMSMPVTSPSSNVMSPMNPPPGGMNVPSQSPQPDMSPQQFHHGGHPGHFSGSQSPATSVSQSPRNEESPFSPTAMQQRPMSTVSPQGSMSPQQGPPRHGSPQPMNVMQPGMRPPIMAADQMRAGRFIRPQGAPGKEMRPRMVMGPQGQRQPPNFGPRGPMHIRNPSPVYSGPMGSPAHQPQYGGGVSPQHAVQMQQQPQMPPQQMRPPSASGSVTSPATADRPVTPQTPRTPGPPTPGHGSQPPTPGHPSQPPTPDHNQFAQPSPQHMPHHMQPQFMQQQPHHHMQQGGGGGQGGPVPLVFDDFRQPSVRGGWGRFIGLKGGGPGDSVVTVASTGTTGMMVTATAQMAMVTTAPLITNLPQQQQHSIVSTATDNMSAATSTVASTLTAGGFTQVRPLQVTTTAVRGPMPQVRMQTATSNPIPVRPNLQQMPPSSAHQANVGIPGGFNPREAMAFQSLQGTSYSADSAKYPNPENKTPTNGGQQKTLPVPPMPPVVSTAAATTNVGNSAVNDIKSTVNITCPVTVTDVLSTPMTTVPSMINNATVVTPAAAAASTAVPLTTDRNALSSSTVGQSVQPTSVLQGAPIASVPSIASTMTSSSQQPPSTTTNATGNNNATTEQQQQNALLKQLLSGSNASTTTTTTTTSVTTDVSSSLEAQLERPAEFKQMPSSGLTSLASAIPQPNSVTTVASTSAQPQQQPPPQQPQVPQANQGPPPVQQQQQQIPQPQMTKITMRPGGPPPPNQMGQPTRLNLPTVPVPEAKLRPQGMTNEQGQPRPMQMQQQPQQQPQQPQQRPQMVMTRAPMMIQQQQQQPNLPQVPVSHFPQNQQPQTIMRPMMMAANNQQGQQGPHGQDQNASQLQGLLQQQTLVPQNQLSQQQQQQQQQQSAQQQQPQFAQQQQQQQQYMQMRPGAPGGPHPRMRMMQPGGVRMMQQPQQPPQQPPQQMQMQQQRFRLQQYRGPMPTGNTSGEPLRPHFPPQQPMQVMRMPITSGGHQMQMQQQPNVQMVSGQPPQGVMMGQQGPHPMQSMQHMRPPPPGMATGSLRLSIPPQQQAMPPQPRTPGSTGSQQPSPALTPRSDLGDDVMDSSSSRGPTPAPGEFEGPMSAGPNGPDAFFPNGEPPQKVVKRRPSNQQKRRLSQSGMLMGAPGGPPGKDLVGAGPHAKKRARKGSRVDDSDYDSYLDSVMSQLKNLPPVATVEPRLHHFYNACPIFGCGEMPKTFGYDLDTKFGGLEGSYGNASLPNEGDYYNTMPFGPEPPVPNIKTVTITARGFYNQEFEVKPEKKPQMPPSCMDSPSPDLFYSSSPEPEVEDAKKAKTKANGIWHDLEPDDSDEDEPLTNGPPNENGDNKEAIKKPPPQIVERPRSPEADLVVPIPIKPRPAQIITLNAIKDLDKENKSEDEDAVLKARNKSVLPVKASKDVKAVTLTVGNNSNKSVLRVLNGLSKLLNIDPPKQWMIEDKSGNTRDMFRCKIDNGVDSEPMETSVDLQTVLTSGARFCRHCDTAVQANMVKKKTSELSGLLGKTEKEEAHDDLYFCDENCYFQFAINRADKEEIKDVKNLEELAEWQAKQKAIIKKEEAEDDKDDKENDVPKHKGVSYKTYSNLVLKSNKKYKSLNENELTAMMFQIGSTMMPPREKEDTRACLFCHLTGDGPADGPARLLNYDVDKWVHLNCALWSEEVYETVSGALVNVETALKKGVNFYCKMCEKSGATVKCFKPRCTNYYHVGCATKDRATFYKNKSIFCNQHTLKGEKDQELTTLAVYRRVYIERDENHQVAKVMSQGIDSHILRIGSLTFVSVGQLLPHQLHNFHNQDYIYPIGFKVIRYYWSLTEVNKRGPYTCSIGEVGNKPEFRITTNVLENGKEVEKTFADSSAKAVWQQILVSLEKMRKDNNLVKVFPMHITGEDLFGLNEPNIIKVLESLPGIESLADYTFKYGRNPLLELPLAVNPSGCARSEPQMRTRVKRVHNFQRTTGAGPSNNTSTKNALNRAAKEMVPTLIGLETTGPYSKNFVQSKSSQYRKMKQEWRQNVVLARSKIQGLGLYAARDLEKHQMIIEYIGEVIRSELTDIREKRYESQNRGIYMFRLDDERVLDATMCGGMARYINHSCDPNCVTETVEVDRDVHIIIFANRRIARGEELSYDYKFDFEDENKIPCMCGAKNCCKWMN